MVLDRVWPDGGGSAASIWEYVRRLRRKLGDTADSHHYIVCDRGVGYCFTRTALGSGDASPAASSAA
jgi:DNA-binding response OmpR family regulator